MNTQNGRSWSGQIRVASRTGSIDGVHVHSEPRVTCCEYHEDARRLMPLLAVQHTSIRIACWRMPVPSTEPALTQPQLSFSASLSPLYPMRHERSNELTMSFVRGKSPGSSLSARYRALASKIPRNCLSWKVAVSSMGD